MVKLVAIDLDGTLYDSKSQISKKNKKAITECLNRGIKVVLSTGKTIYSVKKIKEELKLVHPQIASGGAAIIDTQNKLLFEIKVPKYYADEAVKHCRKHKKGLALSASDGIVYYEQENQGIGFIAETGDKVVKTADLIQQGFTKDALLLTITISPHDPFNRLIGQKLNGTVKLRRGGPFFLNILNREAGKTFALKKIMKMLNIEPSHVIAIGDSQNDVGMLRLAGKGIVMGNASHAVKNEADFIVADNNSSGVAEAIYKFALAGKS